MYTYVNVLTLLGFVLDFLCHRSSVSAPCWHGNSRVPKIRAVMAKKRGEQSTVRWEHIFVVYRINDSDLVSPARLPLCCYFFCLLFFQWHVGILFSNIWPMISPCWPACRIYMIVHFRDSPLFLDRRWNGTGCWQGESKSSELFTVNSFRFTRWCDAYSWQ